MGIILAQSQCNAGACGARCDNRVDNDHFDVVNKCSAAKDFVRQVDWRLSGNMLRYGLCQSTG